MKRWLVLLLTLLTLAFSLPACEGPDVGSDSQDAMAASGKFELFVDDDGQHYFQLLARNGQAMLTSEAYASRTSAANGAKSARYWGQWTTSFRTQAARDGGFYFQIRVPNNGRILGTSRTYDTEARAAGAVEAVRRALASVSFGDAAAGAVRFELQRDEDGRHTFHLRARNGQIMLVSNTAYSSKGAAERGIESVENNAVDASRFTIFEGEDGSFGFRLRAAIHHVIGQSRLYATKASAQRAAARVRELVRELTGAGAPSDAELQAEVEAAAEGLYYMSEGDYPFSFVSAQVSGAPALDEDLVRSALATFVDTDPAADGPLADLYGMSSSWDGWKQSGFGCDHATDDDEWFLDQCARMASLEQVLEANLRDIHVFYFGSRGHPGSVEGIAVSVFIVGFTSEGTLAGVRTIAIWT